MRRALTCSSLMVELIGILMSKKGMSQLKMRARDHALYLYPIMKDSKRAFKPLSCHNTTAASRYRASMPSGLCSLCMTITALSRTLGREANGEKFAHSIAGSKNNSDNAGAPRLAVHWRLGEAMT